MIRVVPFDADAAAWDDFITVQDAGAATFCHLSGWREAMHDVLGHETPYLVAVDSAGAWRGVLPLVRVRSRLFGDYLVSLPFLNYGGPVGEPEAADALALHAVGLAHRWGVDLLELRTRRPLTGALRVAQRKVTVLLPLGLSADELWNMFPSKLRSQIRRAEREGFEPRFGPDQVDAFYHVFSRHMKELGTPVLPRAWFERLARLFPTLAVFGAVYHGTKPVAAGCGFAWRGEFEITWASDLRAWRRAAPNMLLYWACMRRMIERGVHTFNFGRCTPGGGTHRFKQQWGGTDAPLPWAQWAPRGGVRGRRGGGGGGGGGVEATPNPDQPVYRLAARAWRHLPLALTNALGPVLARCLP